MNWKDKYNQWIDYPQLDKSLRDKLALMTPNEIEEAFYTDLEFGTGGMRGEIGPGTNRMNIYTIRKANIGFARFLLANYIDAKTRGVVIAYDNRHYSYIFALESAKVLGTLGIKTHLFDHLRPTPELSFAVRHLKACGGIVITASHNPPQYNGYKIYDEDGCQLLPELANQVIENIKAIDNIFSFEVMEEEDLRSKGIILTVGKEIDDIYIEKVKSVQVYPELDKTNIRIVFTPLHGTSHTLALRLLSECGYKCVFPVEEQCVPDANFATVKSPNPENESAFELAINLGKEKGADILLATDPDADRVGLAVRVEDDYQLLTGNQTGAILLYYLLSEKKKQNTLPKNGIVYNTIVTSDLGANIVKSFGLEVESTLTGFKYIGNKAKEIENTDKKFFFGYEESYGYLISDFVRDKDSLQALLICCEAAAFYKKENKTLVDVLNKIYEEYGYYSESLINISLTGIIGQKKINQILADFRFNLPHKIGQYEVVSIEDYLISKRFIDSSEENLTLPKSDVLKFFLVDKSWFALRPSGTEPKLKVYINVIGTDYKDANKKIQDIKQYLLQRIEALS